MDCFLPNLLLVISPLAVCSALVLFFLFKLILMASISSFAEVAELEANLPSKYELKLAQTDISEFYQGTTLIKSDLYSYTAARFYGLRS